MTEQACRTCLADADESSGDIYMSSLLLGRTNAMGRIHTVVRLGWSCFDEKGSPVFTASQQKNKELNIPMTLEFQRDQRIALSIFTIAVIALVVYANDLLKHVSLWWMLYGNTTFWRTEFNSKLLHERQDCRI